MEAKTYPLQDILKPERRYIIPTFQRDYEWTLEGQWRLLFEDLASTSDRLLEVRNSGLEGVHLKTKEKSISPHFLGAIVCASLPFATGGVALRSVIDGQQRLTTLQLLIRGLLDALVEQGSDRAKAVRRMLRNPMDVVEADEEVYKLWPRRKDREFWPLVMSETLPDDPAGSDNHAYLQARAFFAEAAREYAKDEHGEVRADRLISLADTLSSLFMLVVIDLDDQDDAQVIFEVLNGRQTKLSAIDLVKNLLFLRAEVNEDDVEALYDEHWAQFDDPWWKQTVGRGHAARGHRDVLLSVWLTAALGEEANVSHLYRETRRYLDDGPSTQEVLQELSRYSVAYRTIYGELPIADARLAVAYRRIRSLDITTAIPVLTWLATLDDQTLPLPDHVRAVRAVESWSLRRAYVGWQTRGYGAHLAKVLRSGKVAQAEGSNIANAVIQALGSGALAWPDDAQVRDAFQHRQFYGNVSQLRIRLLLGAIDEQLRSENSHEPAAVIEYDNLQIEHVLPQSWVSHWPLYSPEGPQLAQDKDDPVWLKHSQERDLALNRIGNLTLVTGTFNRDASNKAWDVKRPEFAKQKTLVINHDVASSEVWDEQHMKERAGHLADVVIRIWPDAERLSVHGDWGSGT